MEEDAELLRLIVIQDRGTKKEPPPEQQEE